MKILFIAAIVSANAFAGLINKMTRSINLSQPDVFITTLDIQFLPETNEDNHFKYTVASDFAETLVSIQITDALRGKTTLPLK